MKNKLSKNDYFATYDLGLSAVLLSLGFVLKSVNKSVPQKVQFIFEKTNQLYVDIQGYWAKGLRVEPQSFLSNLKMLKNRIYSDEL